MSTHVPTFRPAVPSAEPSLQPPRRSPDPRHPADTVGREAKDTLDRIEQLFRQRGASRGAPCSGEPVSSLEHALQCAQLAEWTGLGVPLVAAALLHDIGRLLEPAWSADGDDSHDRLGAAFLAPAFPPSVVEPVKLHVQAKRYLAKVDPLYALALSPASMESLRLQGGCMTRDEVGRFESLPFAAESVTLRRLDDLAHRPGRPTPPLARYLLLLEELVSVHRAPAQTEYPQG